MDKNKLMDLLTFRSKKLHEVRKEPEQIIQSFKKSAKEKRTPLEKFADSMTKFSGSVWFLIANIAWFVVWIVLNSNVFENIEPFDPFPFGLLTMIVSLEAIVLSTIVLISQNRETRVNDLRSEIDARIDIVSEEKITKVLELLTILMKKNDIDLSKDELLIKMLEVENKELIEKQLEEQI